MTKRKGSLEYLARFMCPRCKRGEHHNCNDKGCECSCRRGHTGPDYHVDDLNSKTDPKNDAEFKRIMDEVRANEKEKAAKNKVVKQSG